MRTPVDQRRTAGATLGCVVILVFSGCLVGERSVAPDADGDNLPDEAERAGWEIVIFSEAVPCDAPSDYVRPFETRHVTSNPLILDNDTDGLRDDLEFIFRTDPEDNDTDDDGLSDKEEFDIRYGDQLARASAYSGTDPDSDEDCLPDAEELAGYDLPGFGLVATDPSTPDSDFDGLTDYEEVFVRGTHPTNEDTDGDGARDNVDIDPLRDVALVFSPTSLRVDQHPGGRSEARVGFQGSVDGASFQGAGRYVVPQGQWTDLPDGIEPGYVNVRDFVGGEEYYLEVWFTAYEPNGTFIDNYNFNPSGPNAVTTLLVYPRTNQVAVPTADGPSDPGNSCLVEGVSGAFRFDVRVGGAGQDPASYSSVCA